MTVQQLDPGGQVHFVTYAINSQLYIFGLCYLVCKKFQLFFFFTRQKVSGKGLLKERGKPTITAVGGTDGSKFGKQYGGFSKN